MGDGGLTIGSACHQNYIINGNTKVDFSTVYLERNIPMTKY